MLWGQSIRASSKPRGATRMQPKVQRPKRVLPWRRWLTWCFNSFALVVLVVTADVSYRELKPWLDRPISQVSLEGEFQYIDVPELTALLRAELQGTFFSLDLQRLQQMLEADPWVERAEIRRVWPDEVVITLEEQLPVARWGDEGLVNPAGEVFSPANVQDETFRALPQLFGPQEQAPELMRYFSSLSQQLRPLGMNVDELVLEQRGAWTLGLSVDQQPLRVLMGREDLRPRLHRFMRAYQSVLKERVAQIEQVDVRHTNGVAVRWRPPAVTAETPAKS